MDGSVSQAAPASQVEDGGSRTPIDDGANRSVCANSGQSPRSTVSARSLRAYREHSSATVARLRICRAARHAGCIARCRQHGGSGTMFLRCGCLVHEPFHPDRAQGPQSRLLQRQVRRARLIEPCPWPFPLRGSCSHLDIPAAPHSSLSKGHISWLRRTRVEGVDSHRPRRRPCLQTCVPARKASARLVRPEDLRQLGDPLMARQPAGHPPATYLTRRRFLSRRPRGSSVAQASARRKTVAESARFKAKDGGEGA